MTLPDPAGHDAGVTVVRAITVIACMGGALLVIVLVSAMSRWMIG